MTPAQPRPRLHRPWFRGRHRAAPQAFNVLDHAEDLIHDAWRAEVPVFAPAPEDAHAPLFRDAPAVTNTVRALAELVYYGKKKVRGLAPGEDQWIKDSFARHDPDDYLPGLWPLLQRHFPELLDAYAQPPRPSPEEEAEASPSRWQALTKAATRPNYFYVQDYKQIPVPRALEALLDACGIAPDQRPDNHDFLVQTYHHVQVRLDRLIALSHLLIAGSQSDSMLSRATLEHEYKLQERLRELKAKYSVEHATMELAHAKRRHGPDMLDKLNHHTGFSHKHHLALASIENRLRVGTEQYPALVSATHRMKRIYFGFGQLLLGGFLAAEVIKSVSEWSAVYLHRDQHAYFAELAKRMPGASTDTIEALYQEFHRFELVLMYLSIASVFTVVAVALYYKVRNRAIQEHEKGAGHHH